MFCYMYFINHECDKMKIKTKVLRRIGSVDVVFERAF